MTGTEWAESLFPIGLPSCIPHPLLKMTMMICCTICPGLGNSRREDKAQPSTHPHPRHSGSQQGLASHTNPSPFPLHHELEVMG